MLESQEQVSIPIDGMSCASCVERVEKALSGLPGVSNVVVRLGTSKAGLSYDPKRVDVSDFIFAIESAGYQVPGTEIILDVTGMTCVSCAAHVEGALGDLPGVKAVVVSLSLGTAKVSYVPELVNVSAMKQAVKDVGYEACERDANRPSLTPGSLA